MVKNVLEMITSEGNQIIKHVTGLKLKKNRTKHKQFVVEGLRFLQEAIQHQVSIDSILYSDSLKTIKGGEDFFLEIEGKYKMYQISDKLMEKLSDTENPQGVLAVINMPEASLQKIAGLADQFLVILDGIQDPGNMGTIIRTAEGAGATAVILSKGSVDPYNSKTLRATMGAIFHFPVIPVDNNNILLSYLKEHQVKLIATHLDTNHDYNDISYRGSIALLIGNEANGIREEFIDHADEIIKIPIVGKIESLNASVAAGVLIYKALEDRR